MDHHSVSLTSIAPWTLFFDGSVCAQGGGIGLLLISPEGSHFEFTFRIESECSNNQAEYAALLKGLQLLKNIEADAIEIFGDSMLIVKQITGEYECRDEKLKI